MQDELTYRLIYEMCKRILTLEDDLAAEQALNNSLINFDVVETKALNDAQKEYIRQQDERICKLEEFAGEMYREILLLPEYDMSALRKHHYIDKALELGIKGWV